MASSDAPRSEAVAARSSSGPRPRRRTLLAVVVLLVAVLLVAALLLRIVPGLPGSPSGSSPGASCPIVRSALVDGPTPSGSVDWRVLPGATCDPWTSSAVPVVFWLGAENNDLCDASSWAVEQALSAFGVLPVASFTHGLAEGKNGSTPGVNLTQSSGTTPFLSWDSQEYPVPFSVSDPPFGAPATTFLGYYDPTWSLPSLIVGGVFFVVGPMIAPSVFLASNGSALTPAEVEQNLTEGAGPVYQAVNGTAAYLEAYLWKADTLAGVAPPVEVEADPAVAALERSIT